MSRASPISSDSLDQPDAQTTRRRDVMRLLASATVEELEDAIAGLESAPAYACLKGPEIGLVMLRGRAGGSGQAFNLGEATVTRCIVALEGGAEGYAMHLGRDLLRAERAAVCEALARGQAAERRQMQTLLEIVSRRLARHRAQEAARAATSRVDFFTLVRGEDETPAASAAKVAS